jgi:hypothetical protein
MTAVVIPRGRDRRNVYIKAKGIRHRRLNEEERPRPTLGTEAESEFKKVTHCPVSRSSRFHQWIGCIEQVYVSAIPGSYSFISTTFIHSSMALEPFCWALTSSSTA